MSAGDGGDGGFNIEGSKSGMVEKSMNPHGWEDGMMEVGWFVGETDSKYMDQSSLETPTDSGCCEEACGIVIGNNREGVMTLGCDSMSRSCKN